MCQEANRSDAEEWLRFIGDTATLRLIAEIRRLRCENARLAERVSALSKPNGGGELHK